MAQTIFGTEVPANLDNDDGPYSMGTWFVLSVDGTATHGEWYFPSTPPSEPVQIGIYRDSDQALLGSATFPDGLSDGRHQVAFSPPIPLSAGVDYRVVIWTPDRYVSTSGYFNSDKTSGDIYCPPVAGRYLVGPSLAWPDNNFGNANYWADFVFVPEGDDPAEGTVDTGLNLAVAATGARSSSGTAAVGLGLAVAAQGSAPASGTVALTLGLGVAATGARASLGAADVGLGLSPAATGARSSGGSADLGLNLAVSAAGSNGDTGRPVSPFPFTPRPGSSYPWTPRPVKSFQEVDS
jgi:hypothetical protein